MIATRLLRSSTFRLALLYTALSVCSVVVLLGFIYWATAGYMDRQTDETIEAEIRGLAEQYQRRGLAGLSASIADRVARDPAGAAVYLLADDDLTPIVGNLSGWPDQSANLSGPRYHGVAIDGDCGRAYAESEPGSSGARWIEDRS